MRALVDPRPGRSREAPLRSQRSPVAPHQGPPARIRSPCAPFDSFRCRLRSPSPSRCIPVNAPIPHRLRPVRVPPPGCGRRARRTNLRDRRRAGCCSPSAYGRTETSANPSPRPRSSVATNTAQGPRGKSPAKKRSILVGVFGLGALGPKGVAHTDPGAGVGRLDRVELGSWACEQAIQGIGQPVTSRTVCAWCTRPKLVLGPDRDRVRPLAEVVGQVRAPKV